MTDFNNLKKNRINNKGFSLSEMLVTTLIICFVSVMLVTGISTSKNVYAKTVNAANKDTMLSTTLQQLRSVLQDARNVKITTSEGASSGDGQVQIAFVDGIDRNVIIVSGKDTNYIKLIYPGYEAEDFSNNPDLVPAAAGVGVFTSEFESASIDADNIIIKNIVVKQGDEIKTSMEEFVIRIHEVKNKEDDEAHD